MGQSPESTSYNSDKQGVPFYQGNADFGAVYPNPRIWCNKPIKLAKENDILISVRAPVGALNFSKEECCIGRGLAAITLDSNDFLLEFIYWSLRTGVKELQSKSTGSTFKSINKKTLEEVRIPKISLKEQKDIIRNLTLLTNILAKYKHEIVFLDELVKARFVEMFGDVGMGLFNYQTCKLGDVAKVGSSHRVFTTEFVESGIPFYRGTEIGELANGKKPINPYYISEEHYKRLAKDETKPLIGDLLMPSICNKGQVWMVDSEEPFYYKDGRVLCISPNKEVFNSRFLQYFMREKTLVEYPKIGSGSTFAEFKIFLLKDMDVLVPPLELQNQFASFVEEIDKSRLLNICLKSLVESVLKIRIFSEYKKSS